MPIPAPQITVTGTPITSSLGVGAVAGNAITISGLTIGPSQPGWGLVSSEGGPGYVSGRWQYNTAQPGIMPAQGTFYRSGPGAGGGSGGDGSEDVIGNTVDTLRTQFQLTRVGWLVLGLIATLMLTDKEK